MSNVGLKYPVAAEILNQAEQYANEILPNGRSAAAPYISSSEPRMGAGMEERVVHHYHHYRNPFFYYPSQPTVNVQCGNASSSSSSSSSSRRKNSNDTADKVVLFIALASAFVAMCGFIGGAARELKKADAQIQNLHAQTALAEAEGTGETVQKVVDMQKKMIKTQHYEEWKDIWRLAKMAGCTGASMVGVFVSPAVTGLGLLATAGYGAKWIFDKGVAEGDPSTKENAVRLLNSVEAARTALQA